MADNNYFNPSSMKPQGGGLFDMYFYPQQMQNYMDVQQVARQQQEDALLRHMLETEDYRRDMPVKSAQRQADISKAGLAEQLSETKRNNPAYAPAIMGGEMGDARVKDAAGQVAMGTIPSTIDSTNSRNATQAIESTARRLELLSSASPMMADAEWKSIYDTMPPQLKSQFSPHYSPDTLKQIRALSTQLQNTPAHRADMEKQGLENTGKENVARITGQYSVNAAQIRAQAHVKGLIQNWQAAKTPEMVLSSGAAILEDENVPDPIKRQVRASMEAAARALAQRNMKGSFNFADPMAGQGPNETDAATRLLGGGQQPAPHTMAEVMKLYPGQDPQKIRELYFKKYGVYPR